MFVAFDVIAEQNWSAAHDFITTTTTTNTYTSFTNNPTGTNYPCDYITIYNTNSMGIKVQYALNTNGFILLNAGMAQDFKVAQRVGEVQALRADGATNSITIPFSWVRYPKQAFH